MIKLNRLVKSFGSRVVLRGVNLHIETGQFVTLLGKNGAGKTTLMNIVATLSKPTGGQAQLAGLDLMQYGPHVRRYIGLVSHKTLLYDDLTATQNLRFYAKMYDLLKPDERIDYLLNEVGLWGRQEDAVRTYSRGMKQRLAIARAMLHNPPILLLDEPDTGLDQQATAMFGDMLASIGGTDRTILMTTHHLERSLALGSRVVVLAKGKIVHDVPPRSITVDQLKQIYFEYS